MLRVLLLFLVLTVGIVLGPMLAGHQGYVLIQTDNYNVTTSVTGLAIMLVLLLLNGYYAVFSAQVPALVAGSLAVNVPAPVTR